MKRVLVMLTVVGLVTGSSTIADATHAWGGYHWKRSTNPVALQLIDSVTAQWDASFAKARTDWDVSSVLALSSEPGGTTSKTRRNCALASGKVRVCNYTYGRNGWLGIAEIWISGGHILYGRTKLNDSYHATAPYNSAAWRNLVLCQEVGHTFGLGHQDESFSNTPLGSCMDYSNNPTPNQQPNAHDYEQLETIYAHLDGTASASTSSAPSAQRTSAEGRSRGTNNDDCDMQVEQEGKKMKITFTFYVEGHKKNRHEHA